MLVREVYNMEKGFANQLSTIDGLKSWYPTESKNDVRFLHELCNSATTKQGKFPPTCLAQIYINKGTERTKLRRSYLIIVDLLAVGHSGFPVCV